MLQIELYTKVIAASILDLFSLSLLTTTLLREFIGKFVQEMSGLKMFLNKEDFKKAYLEKLQRSEGVILGNATLWNKYSALVQLLHEIMISNQTSATTRMQGYKQVYYFSMEFLIGKLLKFYLVNLSLEDVVRKGLKDLKIDLDELIEQETDPGLGNGGLGRLAACFLDSMAFLGIKGHGNCIRYKYGMFEQRILRGFQHEVADNWLRNGYPWETRKPDKAIVVRFKGHVNSVNSKGKLLFYHENYEPVLAVPYDVPIIGYQNPGTVNNLRLWSAEPVSTELDLDLATFNRGNFQAAIAAGSEAETISYILYPDDSNSSGKELRLKQEYFLVAAGVGSIVRSFKKLNVPLSDFTRWVAIHINDTHPTLCIPELMRILLDEEGLTWEEAWKITVNTCSFTNHTIMPEALETWPLDLFRTLLPRIYMIVEEIDRRFIETLNQRFPGEHNMIEKTKILRYGEVVMANLAIIGSSSINGVAALHTEILKRESFKEFYRISGYKFNNKTNGVNHRRFLLSSNPSLARLINESIGPEWIHKPTELHQLLAYNNDSAFFQKLSEVKHLNKVRLADLIKKKNNILIDPSSLFDVHVKRIHAYKRQLLNVLKIVYLYNQFKDSPAAFTQSYTFIFGGKAAPGYHYAKTIIKLINTLSRKINQDPIMSQFLQVVFLENFNLSVGEVVYPAADVSEQISTASKEASGTGNMKFMMNGAVTLGTLDGANVEILDAVGGENMFVFGLNATEVLQQIEHRTYNSWEIYRTNPELRRCLDQLVNGFFTEDDPDEFRVIFDSLLLYNDEFFVLKDFASYIEAFIKIQDAYAQPKRWNRIALVNIAESGIFSSDRTIRQYADEIWKVPLVNSIAKPGKQ